MWQEEQKYKIPTRNTKFVFQMKKIKKIKNSCLFLLQWQVTKQRKKKKPKNEKTKRRKRRRKESNEKLEALGGAWAEEKAKEKRGKEGIVGRSIARPKRMRHIAGDALLTC